MRLLPVGTDHAGGGIARRATHPTKEQIVEAMNGNLCRCATYSRIVGAVKRAADMAREDASHA